MALISGADAQAYQDMLNAEMNAKTKPPIRPDSLMSHLDDAFLYGMSPTMTGIGSALHSHAVGNIGTERKFSEQNMSAMIFSRLGWNMSAPGCPFEKISAHRLNVDQAAVFVIHAGKALVIHDDLGLFPSDALVTQLRVLAG